MNFLRTNRALIVSLVVLLAVAFFFSFFYVSSAQSVTCDFGSPISGGQCRGYLTSSGITLADISSGYCYNAKLFSAGATCTGASSNILSYPASVSSGADFLVVGVISSAVDVNPTPTVASVTYNGVAMTQGTTTLDASAVSREDIWYMATSSASSNNVVVTLTTGSDGIHPDERRDVLRWRE